MIIWTTEADDHQATLLRRGCGVCEGLGAVNGYDYLDADCEVCDGRGWVRRTWSEVGVILSCWFALLLTALAVGVQFYYLAR